MSRNSSGTYTLPSTYNPVIAGTTILDVWANATLNDVSTEITNSLDRTGRGGMLAPLKGIDGTALAPSLSFTNEGTLGFFRAGSQALGIAVNGVEVGRWVTGGLAGPGGAGVAFTSTSSPVATFSQAGPTAIRVIDTADSVTAELGVGTTFGYEGTFTNHEYRIRSNATTRITVGNAGNIVVAAPTSGLTLAINQVAGGTGVTLSDGTATAIWNAVAASGINFGVSSLHPLNFYTNNLLRGAFSATGTFTVAAPSSGTTMGLTALSAGALMSMTDGTVTGALNFTSTALNFGTTSNHPFNLTANGSNRLTISGAGIVKVSDLSGTLRNVGLLEAPVSAQTSYTFAAAQSGYTIYHTSGSAHTWNIPADDGSIPTGTCYALVNGYSGAGIVTITITTDTLVWFPGAVGGAGGAGTRSLAAGGRALLEKLESNRWGISGVGLS